jgi:hypothetical protein
MPIPTAYLLLKFKRLITTSFLGTFTESGTVTTSNDNSAIFLGVTDTTEDITSIVYSLTAAFDLTDFAINQVSIAPVPEPASIVLFISGFAILGALCDRKARAKTSRLFVLGLRRRRRTA